MEKPSTVCSCTPTAPQKRNTTLFRRRHLFLQQFNSAGHLIWGEVARKLVLQLQIAPAYLIGGGQRRGSRGRVRQTGRWNYRDRGYFRRRFGIVLCYLRRGGNL